MPRKFYFAAAVALLLAGVFVFRSWLEAHDDRTHMQATIVAQQQLITAAKDLRPPRRTAPFVVAPASARADAGN